MDDLFADQGGLFGAAEPDPDQGGLFGPARSEPDQEGLFGPASPPSDDSAPAKGRTDPTAAGRTDPPATGRTAPTAAGRTDPPAAGRTEAGRFGGRRIIGQDSARDRIEQVLRSGRLGHAYLLTGPKGSGKTALALAFAEWVNGIANLSDPGPSTRSRKSGWHSHPDIHVFFPMPTTASQSDAIARRQLLAEDPYAVIDYSIRPVVPRRPGADREEPGAGASSRGADSDSAGSDAGGADAGGASPDAAKSGSGAGSSKTLRAFYSIQQYREAIRPATHLKPNEGARTVVILLSIDTMRAETANAFLKLLEEPSEDILFILTADSTDSLLPTILSRCQLIRLNPLSQDQIASALVEHDGRQVEDARYLARLSDGNYPLARFLDAGTMRIQQEQMVEFLRASYTQDAPKLMDMIQKWSASLNLESQASLLTALELLLRDLMVFRATDDPSRIIHHSDQNVIRDIAASLAQARVEEMIEQISELKPMLHQNVQFKLIMTVLSIRFFHLLRGRAPVIEGSSPWNHLPAHVG